ncbi:MAG: hypothetical protein FJ110_05525 [Deltaproteobacteria bacterium]|nr:hypothetical protein [Deltaproteobacteria bacterium]
MILHHEIRITGVANQTVYDSGLESTEKEPKRLLSILAQVSDFDDNNLEGWIEKARIFNIPSRLIDNPTNTGGVNMQYSGIRINEIPVEVDLSVGEVFKVALRCGANASDFIGAYVYEVKP